MCCANKMDVRGLKPCGTHMLTNLCFFFSRGAKALLGPKRLMDFRDHTQQHYTDVERAAKIKVARPY
jgi:hypothetical protein